jgi:prepilin-type N-terminal cleavage/methylation domain-containing protein
METIQAHNRASSRRGGFTLVEMLIVIGLMSTVFAAVALTLHSLLRVNNHIREELPNSASLLRLSLQVRNDAHSATSFATETAPAGGQLARFQLGSDAFVTYQATNGGIVRRASRGQQQVHQELFRLNGKSNAEWTRDDSTHLVTLQLKTHTGRIPQAIDSTLIHTIQAALSLNPSIGGAP